jgi:hypothetical protein
MTTEEKQKINVWIPGSLWKQIGSLGYESPTKATIAAFEALVLQEETGSNQEENRKFQEDSPAIKESPDVEPEVKPEASQEDKNHWKEKEATIEKTCKNCLQPFKAKNPKNEYCSPKCRTAYNRKK